MPPEFLGKLAALTLRPAHQIRTASSRFDRNCERTIVRHEIPDNGEFINMLLGRKRDVGQNTLYFAPGEAWQTVAIPHLAKVKVVPSEENPFR